MRLFRGGEDPRAFALAMVGVKMADRLLQLGAGDGSLVAALATKVGLTGRAVIVDEHEDGLVRARGAAEREGVLIEFERSSYTSLPYEPDSFDVVVVNGILLEAPAESRAAIVISLVRVLRSGGRCLIVDRTRRPGLAGLFSGSPAADPSYQPEELLRAGGFKAVRTLGEGNGQRFVEGVIKH
ncbi:MAG: methyltransferase domain-containing protein [Acidobacteriota bacterium]